MRMEFGGTRVDYETAKKRVLEFLKGKGQAMPASMIADKIWPDHEMHSQGAGGAASRILKKMQAEDLVYYFSSPKDWGWKKV